MAGADVWHTAQIDDPPCRRSGCRTDRPAFGGRRGPGRRRSRSRAGRRSAPRSTPSSSPRSAPPSPRECIARGVHVLLGPTVNLARTPIGGRNFECFGEDPVLTAELAVAYIDGLQRLGVAACVKHFVANDTEFERMTVSVEVDEETLRELYLVPFEAAVTRAGVRCVMAAYNRLNGTFCSEHEWLLGDVLRGDWGFDGVVVSDWHGCHSGAPSLRAGLDVEMPGPPLHRGAGLAAEIASGAAVGGRPRPCRRQDRRASPSGARRRSSDRRDVGHRRRRSRHGALIRRAAVAAMVLLKNDGGLLPLGPDDAAARPDRPQRRRRQGSGRWQRPGPPRAVVGPLDGPAPPRLRRHVRAWRLHRQDAAGAPTPTASSSSS